MHEEMGMPKIRTEIRYAKASPELGVQTLQTPNDFCEPPVEKKPSKGKKKKGSKKAS